MTTYKIKTERLGLRNWQNADVPLLSAMNQDKEVMRFFPDIVGEKDTQEFIMRMQVHYDQHGFCYFAVDRLDTNRFIGFIGLLHQDYESHFNPAVDIGWRIKKEEWNQGFASEGARACLEYASKELKLPHVYAVAPKLNKPSENVMIKIGMSKVNEFDHPKLLNHPELKCCVLYQKKMI